MNTRNTKHVVVFEPGTDESTVINLSGSVFGTVLVATGSEAVTNTLQVVAVDAATVDPHPAINLLASAKTLAAGANSFSEAEMRLIAPAGSVRFKLGSAVVARTVIWVLWKN